ncbi:MAG: hypothetical protein O7H41_12845 [Planctomycetota bacterium]|nr:hypothetical protein [Planctomycetota bacterium]
MKGQPRWTLISVAVLMVVLAPAGCSSGGGGAGGGTLAPPTGFVATGADSQVTLDWNPVVGADSYSIYWSTFAGVTKATGTQMMATAAPQIHGPLANGTTHFYVIASVRAGSEGADSTEVSATPLAPPTGVTAMAETSQVTVDWVPSPGASSYNLYWGTSPGVTKITGTRILGIVAPFVHTGLTDGTTHYYVVTAVTGPSESAESTETFAMPIAAPTGVSSTVTGGTEVSVDWNLVTGATSYNLYWATTMGVTKATGTPVSSVTSPYLHTGLTSGVTYYYVVTAVTTVGSGAESVESIEAAATPGSATGVFDPTFGGGWVVFDGGGVDVGRSIVVDSTGRILVSGYSIGLGGFDMAILRYLDDGSLDTTFNGQGWVTHHDAAGGGAADLSQGLTIDSMGRILSVGYSRNGAGDDDMAIWRYDTNGSLDTTFGTTGFVVHNDAAGGDWHDRGTAIAVGVNDVVYATGESHNGANFDMVIWAYDATGAPDLTFGTAGIVIHDMVAGGTFESGRGIVVDSSGDIIVGGHGSSPLGDFDQVLWKYDTTGTLDSSFGSGGVAIHDGAGGTNSSDWGIGISLDVSDKPVVAGYTQGPTRDMVLWRYRTNGTLDNSFGSGGFLTHDNAAGGSLNDFGWGVAIDASGRILVTGWSRNMNGNEDMVIWRYDAMGTLDPGFGTGGLVVHDNAAGGSGDDFGRGITTDLANRILVIGSSTNAGGDEDMVIWRLQ